MSDLVEQLRNQGANEREIAALLEPGQWRQVRLCCGRCRRLLARLQRNGFRPRVVATANATTVEFVEDPGASARAARRAAGQRLVHGEESTVRIGCKVCSAAYRVTEAALSKAHLRAHLAGSTTLLLRAGGRVEIYTRSPTPIRL